MPTVKIDNSNIALIDVIIQANIVTSKGQARKLIEQGGISLNDKKIIDVTYVLTEEDFKEDYAILKKGKKVFYKIEK